jgi:hypothetical protein
LQDKIPFLKGKIVPQRAMEAFGWRGYVAPILS